MDFNLVFLVVVISVGLFLVFLYDFFASGDWGSTESFTESIPHTSDLPGEDWTMIEEGEVFGEEVAWKDVLDEPPSEWGFEAGFLRILGRNGERAAYVILKFSSEDHAGNAVAGICADWGENTYSVSVADEALGVHSDEDNVDGIIFRVEDLVVLVLVHEKDQIERGKAQDYVSYIFRSF